MSRRYLPRSFDYRSLDIPVTAAFLNRPQLENHAAARLRCSLVAGIDIGLLVMNRMVKQSAPVQATGDRVQDDRGDSLHDAAHALPCGINLAGRPVHLNTDQPSLQRYLAEPYLLTSIVPRAANLADRRAEVYRESEGKGLRKNFEKFCRTMLLLPPQRGVKMDRAHLQRAFFELSRDYEESFALVLAGLPEMVFDQAGQAGQGGQNVGEDDIRTALRQQRNAMEELGRSVYGPMLVDEIEDGFYLRGRGR